MKKRFAKLSKAEQERVEASYHDQDPHQFDSAMSRASIREVGVKSKTGGKVVRKRRTTLKPQISK